MALRFANSWYELCSKSSIMSANRTAASSQFQTLVMLRWVLIIATSYLVLFSRPLHQTPPIVALFVAAYLGSNLFLEWVLPRMPSRKAFDIALVLFDTMAVCVGLVLTADGGTDFFPVYFLVVFVGALTERMRLVVGAAVLISVVHLSTLSRFIDLRALMDTGHFLRIPFLLVVALFFGFLVEGTRTRERAEKARERKRRRTEVLTTVTHDLKNPLASIQSLATLLLEHDAGPLNLEQTDLIRRIHANARRVVQLSVNLLNAARIDEGRLTLHTRPVNLSDIIQDSIGLVRTASDLKGVTIRFTPDPGLPTVDVDSLQMERVVSNLLDNAIKYTPAHGTVIVSTHWSLEHLELTIRDNGAGVPPAELPRLFGKYQRGADSNGVEGSGLGLFIVKAIVEAHGGTVEAQSAPGEGTTVTVRLLTDLRAPSRAPESHALRPYRRALSVARTTVQ